MALSFWISNGGIVIDGSGVVICEACPCTPPDNCYADLIAAIRERQTATGRTVWDAVPDPAKSLDDCRTEVNALAPSFVAGTYSGGADVPTMRSSSYATGAADFCALYDLVVALRTTKIAFTSSTSTGTFRFASTGAAPLWEGRASDGSSSLDFSGLTGPAESAWAFAVNSGLSPIGYANATKTPRISGVNRSAYIAAKLANFVVVSQPTGVDHAARIFMRCSKNPYGAYAGLGYHTFTEDVYSLAISEAAGDWATWTVPTWPASPPAVPASWPADPTSSSEGTFHGYDVSGLFCLVDWSFTHV